MATPVVQALHTVYPAMPPRFALLDATIAGGRVQPTHWEYSAKLEEALHPWRVTYYYDISGDRGEETFLAALHSFSQVLQTCGVSQVDDFRAWLARPEMSADGVSQVVIGIDERNGVGVSRLKLYLILHDKELAALGSLAGALGISEEERQGVRPLFYILGLDFDESGFLDAKFYYRIQGSRIRQVVRNYEDLSRLLAYTEFVAYRTCLRLHDLTQMILQVTRTRKLWDFVREQAADGRGEALLHQMQVVNQALAPCRLDPWVIAFPFHKGLVDTRSFNVYFHYQSGPPDLVMDHALGRERYQHGPR